MTNRLAKWMLAEDDKLRAAAVSGESIAEIARRLCRSERGIRHRAQTLGIKLPSRQRFGSPRRLVELGLKAKGK
jgi:DNA-binding NarL/FixJ family response regulator